MKRVLVTGANGQLGLAIKAACANFSKLQFVFASKAELDVIKEEDIAGGVLFLASASSSMITGQLIAIDGGVVMTG